MVGYTSHPIKLEPSPTPPKIHIDQTSPFWKRSRRRRHPPTMPNFPRHQAIVNTPINKKNPIKHTPPKITLIKHRRSGINHGAAAATWQCTTALHNQATDSIPICVEIAREVKKIRPIKREPTPTPPKIKIHLDHTLPFWKQSRCHRTTRLCQHSNLCGNCMRTSDDTSNLVGGPTYTFQNHTTIFLEDQSLTNCHNTISNHNAPSLTTLSSCPNPP